MVKINILKKAIVITLLIIINSCCKQSTYDELNLARQDYLENNLRLDGYYYAHFANPSGTDFFFLYKNGVFQNRYTSSDTTLSKIDEYIKTINKGGAPHDWGIFQVSGKNIKIERWVLSSGCNQPTVIQDGKILNDTTIEIGLTSFANLYKFRRFSPKLDSTNTFVK